MKTAILPILILLFICVFLLVNVGEYTESFVGSQCGLNHDSCPARERCVNGYCGSTIKPKLPYSTGLPVWP
jgi:hypothetical protein